MEFFGPMFSKKKSPLKNSPSRNSPPKIHMEKFTPEFFHVKKKHININKFAGLSRGLGGCQNFVYVFFFSFLMGEKKHINKIPPKIPGQSRENFAYVFFSLCVFLRSQMTEFTIRAS